MADNILVLNSGSSSLKYSYADKSGAFGDLDSLDDQIEASDKIQNIDPAAIGHRVVFGGTEFLQPVVIDENVMAKLHKLSLFAHFHMSIEIALIKKMQKRFPNVKQVACFDTSFHRSMPEKAKLLGLSQSLHQEGVQKYGFHGISYESILAQMKNVPKRLVIAHLGGGASICALKDGKSVDTSMGLTPLGGLMMNTRPGDLDPGVILYLLKEKKMSIDDLEYFLYHDSGLKGISGKPAGMKALFEEKQSPAIEHYCYRVAKTIGSYHVVLGGIDKLVFTGGVGENEKEIREMICDQLKVLGLSQDQIVAMPSQEEKMIKEHTQRLL